MSTEATLRQEPKLDAVDRFFGFAEAFICGPENTTANIELNPTALAREENRPLLSCGSPDVVEETSHAGALFCEPSDLCGGLRNKESDDNQIGLESGGSVVTNLSKGSMTKRRRFRNLFRCSGRHMEEDVIN